MHLQPKVVDLLDCGWVDIRMPKPTSNETEAKTAAAKADTFESIIESLSLEDSQATGCTLTKFSVNLPLILR
jgi:hypothetical protein